MKDRLKRIDDWVFRAERGFTVVALAVMSVVVFFDVVHRTFASDENKAVAAVVKVLGYAGTEVEVGSSTYQSLESIVPPLTWIAFIGLAFFAIRSANVRERVPAVRALVYAVVGVVAAYGLVQLFVKLVPNGLIWSQPLALVLTLWVGFIAASMCTYENKHLKVEAVTRIIPLRYKPLVFCISGLFTAAVCLVLMWLSLRYVVFNYEEYVTTDGQGGLFSGLDVPRYQCFLALPVAFLFMTVRFTSRAIAAAQGDLPVEPELEGLADRAPPARQKPSEVPTEVSGKDVRVQLPGRGLPPSEVPTEAAPQARAGDDSDRAVPPSRVPTDPHEAPKPTSGAFEGDDEDGEA